MSLSVHVIMSIAMWCGGSNSLSGTYKDHIDCKKTIVECVKKSSWATSSDKIDAGCLISGLK